MSTAYYFLPWVRAGMASFIADLVWGKDQLPRWTQEPKTRAITSRVSLPMTLKLNGQAVGLSDGGSPQLYGPGDVMGIDAREIIRTAPLPLTPDYAPEQFAFIEFDRPDFPWLFTPAAHDEKHCLRPWLVLVVVEKSTATITPATGNALPILTCPVTELPHRKMRENPDQMVTDLDESWAWAHAQYAGDVGEEAMGNILSKNDLQNLNLSRLLCPRKLKGNTAYMACLVPAFEAGRKAGLGIAFDPDKEPLVHWKFTKGEEVKLPVYYHWEFSTGDKDPFQELAERLKPLTDDEGKNARSGIARDMDLSDPVNGMGQITLPIPSALGFSSPPPDTPQSVKSKLQDLLTKPQATSIPPPAYGSWHAPPGDIALELNKGQGWISNLNLDPKYRVAAALGTQIVQQEQEHLVAAAWEQVKDLQAVNDSLRQKQLGCCVVDAIHANRLTKLSPAAFAQVCSQIDPSVVAAARTKAVQAAGRSMTDSSPAVGKAASAGTAEEILQEAKNSPQFRRMTRGGGSWAIKGGIVPYTSDQIAPPPGATEGAKQMSDYKPAPTDGQKTLAASAKALDAKTADLFKSHLLDALKPKQTFGRELKYRLSLPATTPHTTGETQNTSDKTGFQQLNPPYGPVTYAPSFPQPMSEPLRDQFPDMLLPGLDKIPNDRAARLVTDAKFIEAYLVGLNHELSREFLWREFPTLLHTTYFQQFWDTRGAKHHEQRDIPKIREWTTVLGKNLAQDRGDGLTFLLIRSELIVRYPNALIYARKKGSDNEVDTEADPEHPVLRFSPIAGVTLLGFDITEPEKWKFFAEQHYTEPFFGPIPQPPTDKPNDENPYIFFLDAKNDSGAPLYQETTNSAHLATEILQVRYVIEIKVVTDKVTQ